MINPSHWVIVVSGEVQDAAGRFREAEAVAGSAARTTASSTAANSSAGTPSDRPTPRPGAASSASRANRTQGAAASLASPTALWAAPAAARPGNPTGAAL